MYLKMNLTEDQNWLKTTYQTIKGKLNRRLKFD